MNTIDKLNAKRQSLLSQISNLPLFRPGNLLKVARKCGHPNCHCAQSGDEGHPGWQLTRKVNNKTITRRIPTEALEMTREQVDEFQTFKSLIQELTEVNESLCDLILKSKRQK